MIRRTILIICLLVSARAFTQSDSSKTQADSSLVQQDTSSVPKDTLSGFDSFNSKAEKLFKILPVPLYSYSTEAGNIFGLAKFNLFALSKKDTVSKPSKLSEVVTFSSKGRINASVSTELVFNQNRNIVIAYINYKKQPEYIFGIGNDVKREDEEQVQYERIKFSATNLFLVAKDFYAGIPIDVANYFNIKPDSNSFLVRDSVTGLNGGFTLGTGLNAAYDTRDNRYNSYKGAYILGVVFWHPSFLGSAYQYTRLDLDMRKFFNPWLKHVIAVQATTTYTSGDVPFYDLAQLGGDNKMRGYYLGAYRDKVLVDGQIEYRAPIWKIFGATAWLGAGRVASGYNDLSLDGFKFSYGAGIRIKVDSKHNTNLRFDFGFGGNGIKGTYINFAEAF
jgi:hypothetical protein